MSRRHHKIKTKQQFKQEDSSAGSDEQPEQRQAHSKRHSQKKRKRDMKQPDGANRFFEDEAEEGNDSEGGGADSSRQNIKDQYYDDQLLRRKTKNYSAKINEMARKAEKQERQKEARRKESVKQEKYNDYDADGNPLSDEEDSDELSGYDERDVDQYNQHKKALLPSVSDPKLWQVKVKKGFEKTATFALMNKSIDYQMRGKPLEILSATCFDNIENYIFVEAYRRNSIVESITGLNFCLHRIEILSLNEMPKVFENQSQNSKVIPDANSWVRIKGGLYDKDLAVVDKIISDEKICCKLIPRLDPQPKNHNFMANKKYKNFTRLPQRPFNLNLFGDCIKMKPNGYTKHFYQWKNHFFRKGFLYKTFPFKQIEGNVKPTSDERVQFLDIFEQNIKAINDGNASSDHDVEAMREFFKQDMEADFSVGDKITITKGDLQGATGVIKSVDNDHVVFKPNNLDGFEENLQIDCQFCVKYFEQGDQVRIIEGKYKGETGMVTDVKNDKVKMEKEEEKTSIIMYHPIIKLDKSQRELRVNRNNLKLKGDHDKDKKRHLELSIKQNIGYNQSTSALDRFYRVGQIICYQQNKVYGYIIQVHDDTVSIVNDLNRQLRIRFSEIDRTLQYDNRAYGRDAAGHQLLIQDVVKVIEGPFKGKKGIIKNIQKTLLFLKDPRCKETTSTGIFVESSRHVMILGTEFLKGDPNNKAVAPQNKIIRDRMIGKVVQVIKGIFKGQRGRVTQINGEEAIVELQSRPKKISLPKEHVQEIDQDDQDSMRNGNAGGQSQYGINNRGGFGGGQSFYGPGQGGGTEYAAGKTPMAFNTPMYQPYTPAREANSNAEGANWGAGGGNATPGGNTGYENNYRDQAFSQIRSDHGGAGNWGQEASQQDQNDQAQPNWGQNDDGAIKNENQADQTGQAWG